MTAESSFTLSAPWGPIPVNGSRGRLLVANQSTDNPPVVVTVTLDPLKAPTEVVTLSELGAQVATVTDDLASITIEASSYPTPVLLLLSYSGAYDLSSPGPAITGGTANAGLTSVKTGAIVVGTAAVPVGSPQNPGAAIVRATGWRADPANTGTIYLGGTATPSADDWPLNAGETLTYDGTVALWAVATSAAQLLHVLLGY